MWHSAHQKVPPSSTLVLHYVDVVGFNDIYWHIRPSCFFSKDQLKGSRELYAWSGEARMQKSHFPHWAYSAGLLSAKRCYAAVIVHTCDVMMRVWNIEFYKKLLKTLIQNFASYNSSLPIFYSRVAFDEERAPIYFFSPQGWWSFNLLKSHL